MFADVLENKFKLVLRLPEDSTILSDGDVEQVLLYKVGMNRRLEIVLKFEIPIKIGGGIPKRAI